jgi:hypothetical protein
LTAKVKSVTVILRHIENVFAISVLSLLHKLCDYTLVIMANRLRRSGLTQTFAIPSEEDIYDDETSNPPAFIEQSEQEYEPLGEDSYPDIDETLATFLNDSTNLTVDSLSTVPPSTPAPSTPITPAAISGALFLKRKRQSSTPHRGTGQKDKTVWKHSRQRLSYEPIRDDHGHEIFYCASNNCQWKGSSGNATAHLRKHAIFVGRYSATPSTVAKANSLQQGLQKMAVKKVEYDRDHTASILRNAAQKQQFRNALARYVTACSLSHKSVTSKEFRALILTVNPEADHVLLRSSSSLMSRIIRNFRTQQEEVIRYLHDDTISCFDISTDTWKTKHGHKHF